MEIGSTVVFTGCSEEQRKWGSHADHSVLTVGAEYTVENLSVHSYHTKVWVYGKSGHFNSVCFDVKDDE